MAATPSVSPFTFLTWKEDDLALVAGTADKDMGYIALMEIDGVDADAIVEYAKEVNGEENWQKDLAKRFPEYVQAIASKDGKETFVTKGEAVVEFSDLNTGEVLSHTFPATAAAYNEAVRVDAARSEYKVDYKHGGNDDDDYEDVDEDDEDDEEDESPEAKAYRRRRHLLDIISTQLEAAISLGTDLGLSAEDVQAAYEEAVGKAHPLPASMEECAALAGDDKALKAYLEGTQASALGGMPAGPGGAAGCPQQ